MVQVRGLQLELHEPWLPIRVLLPLEVVVAALVDALALARGASVLGRGRGAHASARAGQLAVVTSEDVPFSNWTTHLLWAAARVIVPYRRSREPVPAILSPQQQLTW